VAGLALVHRELGSGGVTYVPGGSCDDDEIGSGRGSAGRALSRVRWRNVSTAAGGTKGRKQDRGGRQEEPQRPVNSMPSDKANPKENAGDKKG
jgi:hypothetical protein